MKKSYIKPETFNLAAACAFDIAANDINTGSHLDQHIGDHDNDDGTYTGLSKEIDEAPFEEDTRQWGSLW